MKIINFGVHSSDYMYVITYPCRKPGSYEPMDLGL